MKVLVGLGNPGSKYESNRHNVGFMAIDAIARRYGVTQWRKRFHGFAAEIDIDRVRYLLLKPETYMNESGRAVGDATRFYKMSPADVIVFHDELDLEPGKVRAKFGGGNAGHNGLRSITAHIGNDFQRVRIGIGRPGQRELVSPYVLSDFARADADWLDPLLEAIAAAIPPLVAGDDPKFSNEVARALRPVVSGLKADPAGIARPVAPAKAEPVSTKSDPAPVASTPVVEPPEPPVATPAESAPAAPVQPVADPQPATRTAESVKPPSQAPLPEAAPPAKEKELESAMAGGESVKPAQKTLGSKFKKWFGRS
jgi:PTH1 family peptidyl-tRNA hydrolase